MEGQVYTFFSRSDPGDQLVYSPGVLLSKGFGHSDTLPVVEVLPLSHHGWTFHPRTAVVQYQQVKVSSEI